MEDNIMFKDNKVSARVATAWNERYKKEMSSEEYEKWKKRL
jgi:hypothetical protein